MLTFQSDPRIQPLAEAYYLDAVDAAFENWDVELDGSEASVEIVERLILANLHDSMESAPSEEIVDTFVKMFGSYVGEVYRRHHGGEWGWVMEGDESWVGMRRPSGGLCWPWGRVHNRLMNGAEDNVWHYYHLVLLGTEASPKDHRQSI